MAVPLPPQLSRSLLSIPAWAILLAGIDSGLARPGLSLPPPEEVPEEILRTEIITAARSPLTGEPLNAAEYAILQADLRDNNDATLIAQDVRQLIYLLQLRRGVRPILRLIP